MKYTEFKDQTFRVTGNELMLLGKCTILLVLLPLLNLTIVSTAFESTFGPVEGWGYWMRVGAASSYMATIPATVWVIWRVSKSRLVSWLMERRILAEEVSDYHETVRERLSGSPSEADFHQRVMAAGVAGQERPGPVVFEATERVWVDLTTGEVRRQAASQRPPEDGDAASGVPAGTRR